MTMPMNKKEQRIRKLLRGTEDYWVSQDFDHVACIGSHHGTDVRRLSGDMLSQCN